LNNIRRRSMLTPRISTTMTTPYDPTEFIDEDDEF
jgi:hypothetical protein